MTHASPSNPVPSAGVRRTAPFAAALAAVGVALLGAVEPARAGEVPQATVRYADLDLETDAGVTELYRRLQIATRRVCPDDGSRGLHREQLLRECRADALARAIGASGSARLAALQASRRRAG